MASSRISVDRDHLQQLTDDTDDYMSMTIPEPSSKSAHLETSAQRRSRKKRESESRAHQPSKAEIAHRAQVKRDEALNTSLPVNSKGYQMMARLGFKAGSALGKEGNEYARKEPLDVVVKEGKAGIGMDGERKRKFQEDTDSGRGSKKRETAGEFRERQAKETAEKRAEALCWGAMRVLEEFESNDTAIGEGIVDKGDNVARSTSKPTASVNLLWRGLVKHRDVKERQRRMRYDLNQSLSRTAAYDDSDEEKQSRQAWGTEEEEVEVEDPELDDFNGLQPAERLRRMVEYLRAEWRYCFWCKCQYPSEAMDGCPGATEDEHG
ncbi:MAG: hypothetical protein Q9168_001548 [Polycauliona sp. 1 TL-2023]